MGPETPASKSFGAEQAVRLVVMVLCCLSFLTVLGELLLVVPKFAHIFRSFRAELPALTIAVLNVSELIRNAGLLVVPAALALLAGMIALAFVWRFRAVVALGVTLFLVNCLLAGLIVVAMFMPLQSLVEAMQK